MSVLCILAWNCIKSDSSDDSQEEGEGVWSNGEDGDELDDDFVVSAHEVEGEPDKGEGISSSGKGRDEADEHVDSEIKGGNVYSQQNVQEMDKEQPGTQGRAKWECPFLNE